MLPRVFFGPCTGGVLRYFRNAGDIERVPVSRTTWRRRRKLLDKARIRRELIGRAKRGEDVDACIMPIPFDHESAVALPRHSESEGDHNPHQSVRSCLPFWRQTIRPSPDVLTQIEEGVRLTPVQGYSLHDIPTMNLKSGPFDPIQQEWLELRILQLLRKNVVVSLRQPTRVSGNVRLVDKTKADGSKSFRLVGPLVHLNAFLQYGTYSLIRIGSVLRHIKFRAQLIIVFDLEDAYYLNSIYPPHIDYLGFSVPIVDVQRARAAGVHLTARDGGFTAYLAWRAMVMGAGPSGFKFESLVRPVKAHIQRDIGQQHPLESYVDDNAVVLNSTCPVPEVGTKIKQALMNVGIRYSESKSDFAGKTKVEFIGWVIDTVAWTLAIAPKRLRKTIAQIDTMFETATRRDAMSLAQRLCSMTEVLGASVTLHSRGLYKMGNGGPQLDETITLSTLAALEMRQWRAVLMSNPSRPISAPLTLYHAMRGDSPKVGKEIAMVVATDASDTGTGAIFICPRSGRMVVVAASLDQQQRVTSSCHRELVGILRCIEEAPLSLAGQVMMILTDAMSACWAFKYGSSIRTIHAVVLQIHAEIKKKDLRVLLRWCARSTAPAQAADAASRLAKFDYHDYHLTADEAAAIARSCGRATFDADLFASKDNAHASRFYALLPTTDPRCIGLDALSHKWPNGFHLAFPPSSMLAATLRHKTNGRELALVVPSSIPADVRDIVMASQRRFRRGVRLIRHVHRRDVVRGPTGAAPMLAQRYPFVVLHIAADFAVGMH